MTLIRNYYTSVLVEKDKRDLVKAQRNYLIKMYETTMEDMNILDRMADRIRKRWIKLQQKPKPLNRIGQFKERYTETEIQAYQSSLGRISKSIRKYNEKISHKIVQCNIQLGYDKIDLENGSPTESEDEKSSYEDLSDNDTEEKERAMLPIPYPCCNEIYCIRYDQIDTDEEYKEYCQNYDEQTAETP
ncbi:hypothetical protein C1646_796225 [Rhizophagus diaphanus]|nr:hypothetical protein C1646_796225 [Rhizophagus diaphanus] [Rhizophagus sp. MUCL 43196]